MNTDINRDHGWEYLHTYSLRAIANISIDDTWSALRFNTDPEGMGHCERMAAYKKNLLHQENRILIFLSDFQMALAKKSGALNIFNKYAFTFRKEFI